MGERNRGEGHDQRDKGGPTKDNDPELHQPRESREGGPEYLRADEEEQHGAGEVHRPVCEKVNEIIVASPGLGLDAEQSEKDRRGNEAQRQIEPHGWETPMQTALPEHEA